MIASITVTAVSVVLMFVSLLFFPEIKTRHFHCQTFYFGPLLGAILILAFHWIDYDDLGKSLIASGSINPLEILALFLSMSFLSIVLDEAGFFSYIAAKVAKKAKGSQFLLFLFLYLLTSVLTVFTSNDIVILTFTPFIIFFCKRADISPLPYLVSEFVAANTWSMLFVIGNPTNIYLAESFSITFTDYFLHMGLATLLAGLSGFLFLYLVFRKSLKKPFAADQADIRLSDPFLAYLSLGILAITIVMMAVSDFIDLPMWIVSLAGAGLLLLCALFYGIRSRRSYHSLADSFRRLPYEVVPFILSMFVLVLSLKDQGVLAKAAEALSGINPYLGVGLISFVSADCLNNIPMSVLFTEIFRSMSPLDPTMIYLAIISSNIGAFLTPVGALAGVLWKSILRRYGVKFRTLDFFRYLSPVSVLSLLAAFLGYFLLTL